MISEDFSDGAPNSSGKEILRSPSPVTPLERHLRHGHSPAILLVNSRATLAQRLERALFEEGFEAIVVEANAGVPFAQNVLNALCFAGFVVIYNNFSLATEERAKLQSAANENLFDLAEMNLPTGDAEAVERVMTLIERLRISPQQGQPDGVN
jgi:hypothetical protein